MVSLNVMATMNDSVADNTMDKIAAVLTEASANFKMNKICRADLTDPEQYDLFYKTGESDAQTSE